MKEPAWAALSLAVFFVALEMMKASRSSQWCGTGWFDYLGLLAGLGLYFVAALLLTLAVSSLGRFFSFGGFALPMAVLVAGSAVWAALSVCREVAPTLDDGVVLLCLAALAAALWLLPKSERVAVAGVCTLAMTVLLAGASALVATGDYFLFAPDRTKWVTLLPAAWMFGVALPGLGAWFYTYSLRALYAIAVVLLPQALSAVYTTGGPAQGSPRPNLVFVVSDALRADYLSLYGGQIATPNLAHFAKSGTLFEEAYSLAPWTLPSMTGMFASEYPRGLTPAVDPNAWLTQIWQYGLEPKSPTLAELLRREGYATAAITSNALLWTIPGLMNGFEVTASPHPIMLLPSGLFRHLPFLRPLLSSLDPRLEALRPHDASGAVAQYARAYLQRVGKRPFFLWLHYIDPHAPYDPPERLRAKEDGPWPFFYPYAGGERWNIPKQGPGFSIAPKDRPYVQSLYEGEIRYVDELMGRLTGQLRMLGLDANTFVCFTSDHGEELWDHGDWGHGQAVYQEEVRVPLMLSGPGIQAGRIPGPVSALDLMPTLADLIGIPPQDTWQGSSLAPVLRGERASPPPRDIFVQGTSNRTWPNPLHAVISEGWKLIRKAGTEEVSLYDLRTDPKETADLSASQPERVPDLRQRLDQWLASFNSTFPAPEGVQFSPDMTERLKGMGYL